MLSEKPWKPEWVLRLYAGVICCLMAGMVLVGIVGKLLPGENNTHRDFVSFMISAACFQGAALVLVHFFVRRHETTWQEAFGFRLAGAKRVVGMAVLAIALVLPVVILLGMSWEILLKYVGFRPQLQTVVQMLLGKLSTVQIIGFGASAILLAPVAEEILFRGILYPTLKQSGHPTLALWVTSLLFASCHMNLLTFLPLTLLALVLTWLYEKTGNLLTPILAHVIFNSINFALLVISPSWLKTM